MGCGMRVLIVEDSPDEGATFVLTLPAAEAAPAAPSKEAPRNSPDARD